jgi:hypothetical protein
MTKEELIELLADKEHASWSRWMCYVFDVGKTNEDGSFTIPKEYVDGWLRQCCTDYKDLSEREKQSDRDEVEHIMPIIEQYNQSRVDPDTAITAFMGWLGSREEIVGPFSLRHDPGVELIKQFCEAQGWHASNERFHQQIKVLKQKYPS